MERNQETQFKIHNQPFPCMTNNISEIFCVILYTKHAFAQLNEIFNFIELSAIFTINFKNVKNNQFSLYTGKINLMNISDNVQNTL